jgi:homoserine O-acetyltransferase
MGSYGPKSQRNDGDRGNQEVIGLDFPVITIGDMVKVQKELIKAFGINKLNAVIGGSMGGMCVLEWLSKYPEMIEKCMVIASSAKHSAQNIAFNEIGRQAIMADPNWQKGKYNEVGTYPSKGLAIARMMAHVTYLSESGLQNKFGRNLQDRENITYGFDADFQIESYLRYQGMSFIERFDPNSYLYITRAMDYFDLESEYEGNLAKAFENAQCSVCVVSFSSDWLFTPEDSKYIVQALSSGDCDVSFVNIETDKGHDAFLLPDERFEKTIRGFLSE